MDTVILKPLFHRNRECIGLYFSKNQALNVLIRRITGMKWSLTNKCWYIPRETRMEEVLKAAKSKAGIIKPGSVNSVPM